VEPRCIGGRIGMVGGLHTWTRALRYHPPGHDLVPGGGLTAADRGLPARPASLGHVQPLSGLFRAKCRDARHQTDLCPLVDAPVWHQDGVVHGAPVGRGAEAFRYLAPDLFRVALSNNRLLTRQEGHVTVQDQASATDQVTPWTNAPIAFRTSASCPMKKWPPASMVTSLASGEPVRNEVRHEPVEDGTVAP